MRKSPFCVLSKRMAGTFSKCQCSCFCFCVLSTVVQLWSFHKEGSPVAMAESDLQKNLPWQVFTVTGPLFYELKLIGWSYLLRRHVHAPKLLLSAVNFFKAPGFEFKDHENGIFKLKSPLLMNPTTKKRGVFYIKCLLEAFFPWVSTTP